MSAAAAVELSPTTGEPVAVVADRNRLGLWLLIASDAMGTAALLIAYSYLWGLNVNDAWAPPKNAWASAWPFWAIAVGTVVAAFLVWWGATGIAAGQRERMILGSGLGALVLALCLVGQIAQIASFPFKASDGAYASATLWLALSNSMHLVLILFLVIAVMNRTRLGRIRVGNSSHARFVAMWLTWVCVAAFLGALFATTMETSPNTTPPAFGTFGE